MANGPSDPRPPVPAQQHAANASRAVTTDMREAAVARLSAAFAYDVLPMEEFERRVGEVYRVATPGDLAELLGDLPPDAAAEHSVAGRALVPAQPIGGRIGALFSNVERSGRLSVPSRLRIRAVFGNVELDLRDAEFGPGLTEISVDAVFGNVEVRLPANVAVEDDGESILGSFVVRVAARAEWSLAHSLAHSLATVRITGRALLGNVEFECGGPDKR